MSSPCVCGRRFPMLTVSLRPGALLGIGREVIPGIVARVVTFARSSCLPVGRSIERAISLPMNTRS